MIEDVRAAAPASAPEAAIIAETIQHRQRSPRRSPGAAPAATTRPRHRAIVATGVASRLSADRLLRLTLFFDRADSFGECYLRYNQFSEERILPYLGRPERFYGPDGRLDTQFAAHVAQMSAIGRSAKAMSSQARKLSREIRISESR